jgi:threonine synthase
MIPKNESCVICVTGNGLKTQEAVMDHIGKPYRIKPTVESFEKNLRNEKHIKEDVWQSK